MLPLAVNVHKHLVVVVRQEDLQHPGLVDQQVRDQPQLHEVAVRMAVQRRGPRGLGSAEGQDDDELRLYLVQDGGRRVVQVRHIIRPQRGCVQEGALAVEDQRAALRKEARGRVPANDQALLPDDQLALVAHLDRPRHNGSLLGERVPWIGQARPCAVPVLRHGVVLVPQLLQHVPQVDRLVILRVRARLVFAQLWGQHHLEGRGPLQGAALQHV
mmetsp:Transcript_92961/g.240155  ORF Transcript_92961/g.240155 Transcript_92961/m.240155 type:complete len:215 (-) Transcript_92961:820-1464(-)